AFKKRRCLVVADGFYEWRRDDKQPHYITLKSGEPMAFAGLWEFWNSPDGPVESCSICTTEANTMMAELHDRMPVILPAQSIDQWLDPFVSEPDELKPMLRQFPPGEMQAWPVGKAVGNVRNQGAELIERIV